MNNGLSDSFSAGRTGCGNERGNVLFLVLIAVALFAALSFAVTQSTQSGGGDVSGETNSVNSSQIIHFTTDVNVSIARMLINRQDVDKLEFNKPVDFAKCTPGFGRCVFHPQGGGIVYAPAPGNVMASTNEADWIFNGENEVNLLGTSTGDDTSSPSTADLIAFLPGVSQNICASINGKLGISGIPVETGIDFSSASNMVNTNGSTDTSMNGSGATIGFDVSALDHQPLGCFEQGGIYVYYHAVVER